MSLVYKIPTKFKFAAIGNSLFDTSKCRLVYTNLAARSGSFSRQSKYTHVSIMHYIVSWSRLSLHSPFRIDSAPLRLLSCRARRSALCTFQRILYAPISTYWNMCIYSTMARHSFYYFFFGFFLLSAATSMGLCFLTSLAWPLGRKCKIVPTLINFIIVIRVCVLCFCSPPRQLC